MGSELRLHLLGGLQVEFNGQPVTGIDSPRLRALLAYLVLHQDSMLLRQSLALQFWPDSSEAQALTNLRNLLFRLRQTLPAIDTYLYADHISLQWQPDAGFWLDVDAFHDAVNAAQKAKHNGKLKECEAALQEAVNLYTGELLPDCYDDWLIRERDSLHQTYIAHLAELTAILESGDDFVNGILYAQDLLHADNLNESAYRQLMRLHALAGNRAAALRVYHTCVTTLELELGVAPDEQTRSEYERLLAVTPGAEEPTPVETTQAASAPFVGRDREWQKLQNILQAARNNRAQFVLVSGVAGIGKTRLAEELVNLARRLGMTTATARCYAAQGDLPYAPVTAWLRELPVIRLAPIWESELVRLLPERDADHAVEYPPAGANESWRRPRLFEAAARAILGNHRFLILFLDDIQWCDRDTLEWLHYLMHYESSTALTVIATCRIEQQMDNAALEVLLNALERSDQRGDILLGQLTENDTYTLVERLATDPLDQRLVHEVYAGSEGNPLFIVEMMRMYLSKHPFPEDWRYSYLNYDVHKLPPKVRTVLESRLGILSEPARKVVDIAAVVGREFTYSLLAQVCDCDEDALMKSLDELWKRRIIREQGDDAYIFSHDRIREVAYEGLSIAQRRSLHLRVARSLAIECDQGKSVAYAQTAMHFVAGGEGKAAIPYYKLAGDAARYAYAYEEAMKLYQKALDVLKVQPRSDDHVEQEVALLLSLGPSMVLSRECCIADTCSTYDRAWELCASLDNSQFHYQALVGLRRCAYVEGEMRKAVDWAAQLIARAEKLGDPALLARAYGMITEPLIRLGEFRQAVYYASAGYEQYLQLDQASYLHVYGSEDGTFCLTGKAIALQFLGYFDQAKELACAAMELAESRKHPYGLSMAHNFIATFYRLQRDVSATQRAVETAQRLGTEHGFTAAKAWAAGFEAWAQCQRGDVLEGIRQLLQADENNRLVGFNIEYVDIKLTLCEAYVQTGDMFRASHVLDQALDRIRAAGDHCWEARAYRLRGDIHLHRRDFDTAERSYHRAIEVAQVQENRLMELRASVSLARVLHEQDRNDEAKSLLQAIYDWFTEGFDTPDLVDAVQLLGLL